MKGAAAFMLKLSRHQPTFTPGEARVVELASALRQRATPHFAVGAIAVLVALYANFNFIWNHFYRELPKLFDTGWYAHLVHQSSWRLQNPASVVFDTIGPDFYATHFSPLLWIFSWPTYVLPVSPEVWLALLEGMKYAALAGLIWLAVAQMATEGGAVFSPGQRWTANAIVLLAPFNGIALASIAYPHFEGWFIVFGLAFLFALFRKKLLLATAAFSAALLLREDMGFHLCGVLIVVGLGALISRRRWDREIGTWCTFAVAGFVWSCAAVALMKVLFPGDDAFSRVYLGDPPLAHLTANDMAIRIVAHIETKGYLWLPLGVYLVWAWTQRSWWVLLGYAAFLPWIMVNFFARSLAAATLALYYSFPLALALLWPLVGRAVFKPTRERGRSDFGWILAAIVLSIVGFLPDRLGPTPLYWRDLFIPAVGTRQPLEATTSSLVAAIKRGEPVAVDDGVAGLAPADFQPIQLIGQIKKKPTIVGLYADGRYMQVAWETMPHLTHNYRVRGTRMVVVAGEPLDWPHLDLVSTERGSVAPFVLGETIDLRWNRHRSDPESRIVGRGPPLYFQVAPALARFDLTIDRGTAAADSVVICEVVANEIETVIASSRITLADLPSGETNVVRDILFSIPRDQGGGLQVRVFAPAGSSGKINDLLLRHVVPLPAPGSSFAPSAPRL